LNHSSGSKDADECERHSNTCYRHPEEDAGNTYANTH